MKGYKAFNKDLTCRDMQYEIGKTYEMKKIPVCCEQGFHFCKNIADVYKFYPMNEDTRICEVSVLGEVATDDNIKYCTNKIKIVREIKSKTIKHCNVDKSENGYCNSGNNNSGNNNSGHFNSGDDNSGNFNSGNDNSGNYNHGYCNSGDYNSGHFNSGHFNSGDDNSGNFNSGDYNSGDYNHGRCNSGDYNLGNYNSGVFNTNTNPKINIFDKPSNWTIDDWLYSDARRILSKIPRTYSCFIFKRDMTNEEKANNPEYETTGGYVKNIEATKEDKQKWWDNLSNEDKEACFALPNFDADKFCKCIGIMHI